MIGFNKPYIVGKEFQYISEAITLEKLSGNGDFTKKCHEFFESRYGFKKVLLTQSGTAALEMAAILLSLKEGDEVIMPSYTFVSTANAFLLRGAKIVFADSDSKCPNISINHVKTLINPRTKAIVVIHYAGVACDMDEIMELANEHNIFVVEDAAHAIDSFYKGRPLGSIGHLGAFSFHETKNIISGEGGMLVINDEQFISRAEIIWEKGTNRTAFYRGEVDKYRWIDIGSSYLPSELMAAFLYAQLEQLDHIQNKRKYVWQTYYNSIQALEQNSLQLPHIEPYATNNAHIFYLLANNVGERDRILEFMKSKEIQAIFHYLPLHSSPFYTATNAAVNLPNAQRYGDCLIRLPLFVELTDAQVAEVVEALELYFSEITS